MCGGGAPPSPIGQKEPYLGIGFISQTRSTDLTLAQVDPSSLEDRGTAAQTLFQRNWNEAHALFKEKVPPFQKIIVICFYFVCFVL